MKHRGSTPASETSHARPLRTVLPVLLMLLAAASCRKPSGDFILISSQEASANGGVFEFNLTLDDSLAVYSTALAARILTSRVTGRTVDFDFHISSPEGETFIERVSLPLVPHPDVRQSNGEGRVVDFEWPYRDNIRVSGRQLGLWKISVTPADPALRDAILGMGLSYKDSQDYGKR